MDNKAAGIGKVHDDGAPTTLRVTVGHDVHGLDGPIYGLMLVLFIIYMPKGILGKILELWSRRGGPPPGRLQPADAAAE